jgi:glycosyltransferase involved in cell wall biosynthesis
MNYGMPAHLGSLNGELMITIVIPTYNRSYLLLKTLPSYINQNNINEIIIVDDGSTDSTDRIVEQFLNDNNTDGIKIRYIKHPIHKGAASARLTGITEAKNQFILFGEDDVVFDEKYAKILYSDMVNTNADIIAGRIIYLKENETYTDAIKRSDEIKKPLIDYNLLRGNFGVNLSEPVSVPFVHACFLAKKEIYSHIRYDTNYYGNGFREETDPQILALKLGKKIIFTPNTHCFHLHRSMAKTGGQRTMSTIKYSYWTIKNNTYFLKKHYLFLAQKYQLKPFIFLFLNMALYNFFRTIFQISMGIKYRLINI